MSDAGARSSRSTLLAWAPFAGIAFTIAIAWINFLTTARWSSQAGALHGWREPWYALALMVTTVLLIAARRYVARPTRIGRAASIVVLVLGATILTTSLLYRTPPSTWTQIPFKDDWPELFQQAVNGASLLRRGVVVGWNWWFLGGYPTSTDIAQNLGTLTVVPMALFGECLGYHVLHAILFLSVPLFVWCDLRREDPEMRVLATGFACFFAAGYLALLGSSGDTNSLVGVFCVGLTLVGAHTTRLSQRWGGPLIVAGLTLALYTHPAFFVYAAIYLTLEALYFRDRSAFVRVIVAAAFAGIAALPAHWESLRFADFVSFNNTVYVPGSPVRWSEFFRTVYYNVEILGLPHRWFNDYRSLANVWLPVLIVAALTQPRSRGGFYAWTAVATQVLLRLNTPVAGAIFDRIQHMFPLLVAPALAGFVLRRAGTRALALAMAAMIALFVQTSFAPIRHVPVVRAFDPALIDRVAAADGMVLVEISPHRDMDSSPSTRTQTTPFDVHFEGLLPRVAGQRFYSQMIDGWVWNVFRGQVVGAGTFAGKQIDLTPADGFAREMERWGVRHLFVWTDRSRAYLARSGRFVERWRSGRWSEFEMTNADIRSVVTRSGSGELRDLDFLGAEVALANVRAGDPVVVRANYYPAWRALLGTTDVPLYSADGQLAFRAPQAGSYVVRLEYPRYGWLSLIAIGALVAAMICVTRRPFSASTPFASSIPRRA